MQSWNDYIKDFRGYLKVEKGLSQNSVDAYANDVQKLKEYSLSKNLAPEDITSKDLKLFIGTLYDLGLSARTQARIISGIKSFFNYLLIEEYIKIDPSELLEMPTLSKKLPEVLDLEEIDALIAAVDMSKPEGQRNRAILETLYSCGLRVSELVNLRFEDLFFDEGFIRVIGKGNKQRLVPVSPGLEDEIDQYVHGARAELKIKHGNEAYVFLNRRGAKLTRVMIFTIIKNLADKISLKKKVSPHTFRHSFATHLLEGGANLRAIQEMLGHESITTTEIYTHLDQSFLREAIISFHPRNQK